MVVVVVVVVVVAAVVVEAAVVVVSDLLYSLHVRSSPATHVCSSLE